MKQVITAVILMISFSIQAFPKLKDDPSLKRIVLDNGLVIILKEKHDIPMVAMQMWVKAGSITEGKHMGTGLSHYFEHMLGKRTTHRKTEQYYNDIRKMGGSDTNAYTTYDRTVYLSTIRSEFINDGVDALSDMIQNSIFDEEESQKEINVILKEINMGEDSPDRYLWQQFAQTVYTTHPYKYPVIGYRHLFKSLTKKDMLEYYSTMYSPNNMILVLVGDFKTSALEKHVKKAFKDFKRKKLPPIYIPKEPKQLSMRKVVKTFKINTTKAIMGYPTVDGLSNDVAPLDVLALILGQGKTSRLYRRLKDREQLVQSVSASSWTPKDVGLFEIGFELDHKNLDKTSRIVLEEIERIKRKGVTKKELKRAKQKTRVTAVRQLQTLGGYARSLAYGEFIGNIHYDQYYLERVRHVTAKDIRRVAKTYLTHHTLNMVILVPEKDKEKVVYAKNPVKKAKGEIEKIVLKNGLTLLLKKDDSVPLVAIHVSLRGGYRYENEGNQGIYNFLSDTLLKGTRTKSSRRISELIENSGGTLYAASDSNLFTIRGSFLKENFPGGFKLLLDILSNANFPKREINKVKKDILSDVKQRDDSIWSASRYHLRRIRYKSHPYAFNGIGTKESITNISSKDLSKVYQQMVVPNNMVLAIFGDFNKRQVLKLIKRNSRFNKRKAKLPVVQNVAPLDKVVQETYHNKENQRQSIIKILFDGPNYYNRDKYPLIVLTHVFSGIGSRLFLDLRSKRTLAYATGGIYQGKEDIGLFLFYIGTEPAKKKEAIKGLFENITKVKEELVTERELDIAKNSAIGRIIKQLETLNGQAGLAASYEQLKLGYNYQLSLIEEIKKVTREDIQRVAKKYFDMNRYAISIVESKTLQP